jgi:hypothetical protein
MRRLANAYDRLAAAHDEIAAKGYHELANECRSVAGAIDTMVERVAERRGNIEVVFEHGESAVRFFSEVELHLARLSGLHREAEAYRVEVRNALMVCIALNDALESERLFSLDLTTEESHDH